MRKSFLKRLYKIKDRLYLEAKYLADYGFSIGQAIKYEVDNKNKKITITPVRSEAKRHVAKTTQKTGKVVPVIDIKGEEVRQFFASHQQVEVEIRKGKIIFTVSVEAKAQEIENVVCLNELRAEKETRQYAVSVRDFAAAANYSQLSIFDLFQADQKEVNQSTKNNVGSWLKKKAISMISLFSGCGSMDKGFLDEGGYDIVFANDRFDKRALRNYHIETYRRNIGDHIITQDVLDFTKEDIPQVDFVAAGIPCVKFSSLNTINNFRDSDSITHPLVEQTLNVIEWSNAKAFLIENVENFLTVKGGAMLKRFKERLPQFGLIPEYINAAQLGSAQKRTRAFILGIRGASPTLQLPHLSEYRTVADAFQDIENAPQQDWHFNPTPLILERMKHVPEGGNITSVPQHLRAPNKKFTNYCMRLNRHGQAPVITHVQDEVFFHYELDRYLTVRETARLFSLPDDFVFTGSLTAVFEMLKNAVDYKVSRFLAKIIRKQLIPIL